MPFFSPWHFQPAGDWSTTAACLGLAGMGLLAMSLLADNGKTSNCRPAFVCLLLFSLLQLPRPQYSLPFSVLALFLCGVVSLSLGQNDKAQRDRLIACLASLILVTALLQAMLGFVQALGLAPQTYGWVLFTPGASDVMGNFGQRNQLAQFLGWGAVSAAYLYATGRMGRTATGSAVLVLALLMSWTGARLPLAYGLGLALLAWFWHRRVPQDETVARMARVLAWSVLALALIQIFNQQIDSVFQAIGLPIHVQSGSDRLLDAGFGARRRIEWSKAWEVFMQHPWFGVGLGGYAWHSAWLEAYGGWPKVPESWLFTHCHNLIFQLLVETGLVGTLLVVGGLLCCLLPYFRRGEQTADNLLLISIAMMLLGHSMFEYPLWYFPFLLMLVIICSLSPAKGWTVQLSERFRQVLGVSAGVLALAYVATGILPYRQLIQNFTPRNENTLQASLDNAKRSLKLSELSRNPLWSWEADLGMVNYLQPDGIMRDLQLELAERVARYQPFPTVLIKLSILRALNGQAEPAKQALTMAIANYPDYTPVFQHELARYREPELKPLQDMASKAVKAGAAQGGATEAGRLAAVMTVAAPATRQPIF
ncbi:PglL family O-oligosaccharyltransferase [Chromobacterium violaceum]|uniref:PglL family O-oligosaccharyltransferase n=1 Tax=Chromobacterium violaceum TaxID=536 RepID=UPI0018AF9280|nr:Wzy polymerase domain-containing protein [Chromobacterium violaceum]